MQTDELALLTNDLRGAINLFVGAGFSTLAGSATLDPMPVGDDLKTLIIDKLGLNDFAALDLPGVYAIAISEQREKLRELLRETFTVTRHDDRYDALRGLDVSRIYTNNIDGLMFRIFDARPDGRAVLHDFYSWGAPRNPSEVVEYIPLHGCVRHDDGEYVFTAGQISSAFASDRETWYVFQRELQLRPTIYLGYGMRDAGVLQANYDASAQSSNFNRWILLKEHSTAAERMYKSMGFHVLVGGISDFLETVKAAVAITPAARVQAADRNRVGRIPPASEVAQRPIRAFFLGAEPAWSDAYSPQIFRRRALSTAKNSVLEGKHVVLVGLPLAGKSTLLKQLAIEFSPVSDALFFDRISVAQADEIIAQKPPNNTTTIFVDNLIDSREAVNRLLKGGGFQIVGAETSLYFDAVNLKEFGKRLAVHSCSEIGSAEMQGIIDTIPESIKRWNVTDTDQVSSLTDEKGLFESLKRYVYDTELTDRFIKRLSEFEARDREAFDIYIMLCYCAACRTLTSHDMIYFFLTSKNKAYSAVYDVIEQIGEFLRTVDLEDDPDQDYLDVRSNALASIALKVIPNGSFGRVFERFHSALPDKIITDYHIFRRYGYDNDFARRAFSNVPDGLKFYSRLVGRTDNAYDYQHGAIYLSKMRQFKEAFEWIDTAVSRSSGRIFSIRNTHARILFEANIDVFRANPTDRIAVEGIRESMRVLEECIEKDQRRNYHVLRFADQALQYAQISMDEDAARWLALARDRLANMVKQASQAGNRESYNLYKYRRLLSQVDAFRSPVAAPGLR